MALRKQRKTAQKKITRRPPVKSKDVPATQGMLLELRSEIKADLSALELRMDGKFKQVDARFSQMEGKFNQLESKFDKLISEVHRIGLLVEDQNARNKYVLDGYASLNDRLDKQEVEIAEMKKTIESV